MEEKINNPENPDNKEKPENNGNQMAEDILNEIEQSGNAETPSSEENAKEEEGLLDKFGFGKNKHKKEIHDLKEKVNEVNDKYLRLLAEFDNYKKRNAKERMESMKTAGQEVILSMLPVIDDFERANKQIETTKDFQSLKNGVDLIYNKMKNTLDSYGLKEMLSVGKDFDSELHEAIAEVPAPAEDLKGKVVDEVEKGYTLNNKIIRHAKVIVGR